MSYRYRFILAALGLTVLACTFPVASASDPATEIVIVPYSSPTSILEAAPMGLEAPDATPADPAAGAVAPSPTVTQQPTPAATATPFGCQQPPDDYTVVHVAPDMVVNQRTLTMLTHAQGLYGGGHDFVKAITQGSYNPGLDASFGTHDGGGAVDLSVRDTSTYAVLTDELPVIILALREAGFAAWVREVDELYDGSPIHIHMIAVGDKDLSTAARRQIDGPEGYLRGFNGLPVDPPVPDKWGAPIVCPWMVEMGFPDLRAGS